jgi:hypothetical protein
MTTTAELQKVDTENVAQVLKGVCAELTQSADPVVLDFADVRRIDPPASALSKTLPPQQTRKR